jgi:hypothetical protein
LNRAATVFGLDTIARRALELLVPRPAATPPVRLGDLCTPLGGISAVAAAFDPGGPLLRWRLVTLGDGVWSERTVAVADSFWPRLVGHWHTTIPRALAIPKVALDGLEISDARRAEARDAIVWLAARRSWPRLWVVGPRNTGRATLAVAIAAGLELPVLRIDGAELGRLGVAVVAREAIWQQAVVAIDCGENAEPADLAALVDLLPAPLVAAVTPERVVASTNRPARQLRLDPLDPAARAKIWRAALQRIDSPQPDADVRALAGRFRFGPGQTIEAVEHARDRSGMATSAALFDAARSLSRLRLDGLARPVAITQGWDDLVVPPRVRRELELIVTWSKHGEALFSAGGSGAKARATRGAACLFWGPPGTGKTLAAEVIAGALGRDLYRIDLAQVVDKYLGETEKRLDRLFREAESADAVLLFDEADALFARRTEVKEARDRYANLETGFLLQRLEEHAGLCILSSNARNALDHALQRRLLFVVEFAVPETAERSAIWEHLLPPEAVSPQELRFLVDRFALAGGDIRNAVVSANLLAAREDASLAMRHLVVAGWRELTKAGRWVDLRPFEPWQGAIRGFLESNA